MREHHHHVVEMVVAPEAFMACRIGKADKTVVIAVLGCVAPAIMASYQPDRQAGHGLRDPVSPEKHVSQRPSPGRRCAIALPLRRFDARAADQTRYDQITGAQAATGRGATSDIKTDCGHDGGGLSNRAARP